MSQISVKKSLLTILYKIVFLFQVIVFKLVHADLQHIVQWKLNSDIIFKKKFLNMFVTKPSNLIS